jgi:hypothetical protein
MSVTQSWEKEQMWVSETNINLTAAFQQLRHTKAKLTK